MISSSDFSFYLTFSVFMNLEEAVIYRDMKRCFSVGAPLCGVCESSIDTGVFCQCVLAVSHVMCCAQLLSHV